MVAFEVPNERLRGVTLPLVESGAARLGKEWREERLEEREKRRGKIGALVKLLRRNRLARVRTRKSLGRDLRKLWREVEVGEKKKRKRRKFAS